MADPANAESIERRSDGVRAETAELPFDPPLSVVTRGPVTVDPDGQSGDGALDGICLSTIDARRDEPVLAYVSEGLAAMLGCEPGDLLGRSPSSLFAGETPPEQLDEVARVVATGDQASVRLRLQHSAGRTVPVHATFTSVPNGHPDATQSFLMTFRDLARRAGPERLLAEQTRVLEALARGQELPALLGEVASRAEPLSEGGRCWIVLCDRAGQIEPIITADHGVDRVRELVESAIVDGLPGVPSWVRVDDMPGVDVDDVHALWLFPVTNAGDRVRGYLVVAHPDRLVPGDAERRALVHLTQVVAVAVEHSTTEASLTHQALHDQLTQLPNRALIMDRLEQAVARLGRDRLALGAIVIDVDRFKYLNDTRGSNVGDRVLVEVARRLRRTVRLGDTVGRIGSDQFLVLCVAIADDHDASAMAERIIATLGEPILVGEQATVNISTSAGVVLVDRPGHSAATVISNAESALAEARDLGGGRYHLFEEGLQSQVVVRHEVEQALEVAITADELVLHFQPFVDLATGRMIGAEALVRWNRPGHGLLPPNDFIDIAEETGLIVPLGAWVIDEALRELADWPENEVGERPLLTINLSAAQLVDDSLIPTVVTAIDRHHVPAGLVGFEVTESMQVDDVEGATEVLRRISALGCPLAIDDFGIGYATLDYLRRFSMADTIKIDRSFVSGLGSSREDTAIVSASVALASSLGLDVVAEGVETYHQLTELRGLGARVGQGYVISKPVPIEDARRLWVQQQLVPPAEPLPPERPF